MINSNNSETTIANVATDETKVETAQVAPEATTTEIKLVGELPKAIEAPKSEESSKVPEDVKKETKTESTVAPLILTHLNKDFVYDLMSVPTVSSAEYRLVTFVILWARRNGIKYEFDKYGNVYLTKGELAEGEFYPCVTAHLDSVQQKQKMYAQAGQLLDIKTRIINKKHEIYVDGMGIGGDDKAGVLIGLSMFSHVDKLKACFFLEEEIGCKGSNNLNADWFKDVGYVMGYDSPDLNRAAHTCSGVKLFNKQFFVEHMQEICKDHGLTDFRSEPYTDVKVIREKTNIICMNFGSGYYNGHASNEYCVIEDMDNACRMGHALIKKLGNNRYEMEHKSSTRAWTKNANGTWTRPEDDEDEKFFDSISGRKTYTSTAYGGAYGGCYGRDWDDYDEYDDYYRGYTPTRTQPTTTTKTTPATSQPTATSTTSKTLNENEKNTSEVVKHIVDAYDSYIDNVKLKLKSMCEDMNLNFDDFKSIFENEIKF